MQESSRSRAFLGLRKSLWCWAGPRGLGAPLSTRFLFQVGNSPEELKDNLGGSRVVDPQVSDTLKAMLLIKSGFLFTFRVNLHAPQRRDQR